MKEESFLQSKDFKGNPKNLHINASDVIIFCGKILMIRQRKQV